MLTHVKTDHRVGGRPYRPVLYPQYVPISTKALDRLDWPMQHRVMIAGVRVLVRSTVAAGWDDILEHVPSGRSFAAEWPPALVYSLTPAGGPHVLQPDTHHVLYRGATWLAGSKDRRVVLKQLLSDITLEVAQRAPRWSVFHAGAVTWGDAGIVLAGPSGSGKSTLVAALLRLGATYYSDEVALIDGRGRLHPFLKPVWLYLNRPDELGHKTAVHPASLGARSGTHACPVRMVAFPEWRAGSRVRARLMPRSTAALALFSNGFTSERRPGRTLRHATRAVESATCLHIRYPDAARAARDLLSLLEPASAAALEHLRARPAD